MKVSQQIDQFIAENGGNERDALNVALARLELANNTINALRIRETIFGRFSIPVDMLYSFDCEYDDLLENNMTEGNFIFNWGDYILE